MTKFNIMSFYTNLSSKGKYLIKKTPREKEVRKPGGRPDIAVDVKREAAL
jgi:hypothetical protein